MKQLIKLILIDFILLSGFHQTGAQIRFGPKAGVNFSTTTGKPDVWFPGDYKYLTGFHFGGISEISLGKNLFLQPGFFYSTKGWRYIDEYIEFEVKPTYLELPVNTIYKIKVSSVSFLLIAGPYFGYGIGGDKTLTQQVGSSSGQIKYGSGAYDDLNAFDMGLNFGGGMEYKHLQLTGQYGLGLTNHDPSSDGGDKRQNRVITVSIAYLFGIKSAN